MFKHFSDLHLCIRGKTIRKKLSGGRRTNQVARILIIVPENDGENGWGKIGASTLIYFDLL
jgi:hypothetical protein